MKTLVTVAGVFGRAIDLVSRIVLFVGAIAFACAFLLFGYLILQSDSLTECIVWFSGTVASACAALICLSLVNENKGGQ